MQKELQQFYRSTHIWVLATKLIRLCLIVAVNKNDKADNKMGEVKKPKTAGNETEMQDGWQRWLKKKRKPYEATQLKLFVTVKRHIGSSTSEFSTSPVLLFPLTSPSASSHGHACHPCYLHWWWKLSPPPSHHQTASAQADPNGEEATSPSCTSESQAHQCTNPWPEECPLQNWIYRQHEVSAWRGKGRSRVSSRGQH